MTVDSWQKTFGWIFILLIFFEGPIINYRLPDNLHPFLYELQIKPYIGSPSLYGNKSFTFTGEVSINFTCLIPTNKIVLHSKNLDITKYSIESIESDSIANIELMPQFDKDEKTDFLTFYTTDTLESDSNYTLHIEFSGIIPNKLFGFYRSSYLNKEENKIY